MTTSSRLTDLVAVVRQDLTFGLRSLGRRKVFAATAALTVAVGIAATTVALSIANGVLLESPPIPEPDRVVSIWEFRSGDVAESMEGRLLSYARYEGYRDATTDVFAPLAGHSYGHFSVGSSFGAFAVDGFLTSGNYFTMLGITPAAGRFYEDDDEPVVVISERLWRSRFGGDPAVVGQPITVDSRSFTLGAIAREGFVGTMAAFTGDVWIPAPAYAEGRSSMVDNSDNPSASSRPSLVVPIGRLRAGLTVEGATARVDEIAPRVRSEEDAGLRVTGARLEDSRWRTDLLPFVRIGMATLVGTAAMLLLIACANIASLMLTRGHERQREVAIRLAVGSGRSRIIQQMVTENLLLFLAGGLGGVGLAWVASRLIAAIELPLNATITLDVSAGVPVLAVGVGLAALLGVLFGLEPARQASKLDLNRSLKDGGHTVRRSRTWAGIVVAQISVATLLLVLAGLTTRSFMEIVDVDLGFDPEGVVVATLDLASHGYEEAEGRAFYDELRRRVRSLSGVDEVSLAEFVVLRGASASNGARPVDGGEDAPSFSVNRNVVDPEYAAVNGVEVLAGRFISTDDGPGSPPVAVINQRLASRMWPGSDPLGRRFRSGSTDYEVVGVVRDGVYSFTFEDPKNHAYFSDAQRYRANRTLHVRGGDPASLVPRLRETLSELDPDIALQAPALMTEVVAANRFMPRFLAGLTAVFAVTGLFLAVVGVYGMLASHVVLRRREFAIRVALGAKTKQVVALVVGRGGLLAFFGCAIGLVGAFAAARVVSTLLFGIEAFDPVTFLAVPAVLIGCAAGAGMLPARRAARVEPREALQDV